MVVLIVIAAVVDGRELTPYLVTALIAAIFTPLFFMLVSYLETSGPFSTPIGVGPDAMMAPTWWRPHYVEWSHVQALIHTHSAMGSFAPIDRNLVVIAKDGQRTRLFLPVISKEELACLLTILRTIADRHGFEFVLDHTDEGQKRARELGA